LFFSRVFVWLIYGSRDIGVDLRALTFMEKRDVLGFGGQCETTHKIALDLFAFFAEDWENKNNLLPMQARRCGGIDTAKTQQ
jgi:hypothetical protein